MVWFGQILLYFNYCHPLHMILGIFRPSKYEIKFFRFDSQCIRDIVEKYEENLGFEKAFVSILASKTRREIEEIRRFYKKDFKADLDEDMLRYH